MIPNAITVCVWVAVAIFCAGGGLAFIAMAIDIIKNGWW